MKYLIVKTSAFGDIVQSLDTVRYLKSRGNCEVDWVAENRAKELLNPLVDHFLGFDLNRSFFKFIKRLRETRYDVLFDLQGNSKSALITFLARAGVKVGFSSVSESLNLLATSVHIEVDNNQNMRYQYLALLQNYFGDTKPFSGQLPLPKASSNRIMVCPGAKWPSKRMKIDRLISFLKLIDVKQSPFFYFCGGEEEADLLNQLKKQFPNSTILKNISFERLSAEMDKMDLVIAMDSFPLHLAGRHTKTLGFFGPTRAAIFAPPINNISMEGTCPFGKSFVKKCPKMRTCEGNCMDFSEDELTRLQKSQR